MVLPQQHYFEDDQGYNSGYDQNDSNSQDQQYDEGYDYNNQDQQPQDDQDTGNYNDDCNYKYNYKYNHTLAIDYLIECAWLHEQLRV